MCNIENMLDDLVKTARFIERYKNADNESDYRIYILNQERKEMLINKIIKASKSNNV